MNTFRIILGIQVEIQSSRWMDLSYPHDHSRIQEDILSGKMWLPIAMPGLTVPQYVMFYLCFHYVSSYRSVKLSWNLYKLLLHAPFSRHSTKTVPFVLYFILPRSPKVFCEINHFSSSLVVICLPQSVQKFAFHKC